MILTVRQAEELFCPYISAPVAKAKCASERCPLWRWVETDMINDLNMPKDLKAGYCGAGGRPEVYKLEKL